MVAEQPQFETLPMRRRELVAVSSELYRIVSLHGEAKEVKARTAYEAFKQSGFPVARRIERKVLAECRPVLSRSRFKDMETKPAQAGEEQGDSLPSAALLRKSPVVTADDLDSLMRELASAEEHMRDTGQQIPEQEVTSPAGVEVHQDGFDEIIPAPLSTSQMGVVVQGEDGSIISEKTSALPQEAPAEPPENIVQGQELTPDEVNKLLGG